MNNYSGTKCLNNECKSTSFEYAVDSPTNSNFKYNYVRCERCKTIISILPFHNTNTILFDIEKDIKEIKKKLMIR